MLSMKLSCAMQANKLKVTLKITPRRRWLMKATNQLLDCPPPCTPLQFLSLFLQVTPLLWPLRLPSPVPLQLHNGNKILFFTEWNFVSRWKHSPLATCHLPLATCHALCQTQNQYKYENTSTKIKNICVKKIGIKENHEENKKPQLFGEVRSVNTLNNVLYYT